MAKMGMVLAAARSIFRTCNHCSVVLQNEFCNLQIHVIVFHQKHLYASDIGHSFFELLFFPSILKERVPLQLCPLLFRGDVKKHAKTAVRRPIRLSRDIPRCLEPPIALRFCLQTIFAVVNRFS